MPDAYLPALGTFALTPEEQDAVAAALATAKPWKWNQGGATDATLKNLKSRIRQLHLLRHGQKCCYCRFPLQGGGGFVIDLEHILPKSINNFRHLSYEVWNLSVACKRCNMQYKKAKVDFVVDCVTAATFQESSNYRLIHPNFDQYKEHLDFGMSISGDVSISRYALVSNSIKGKYTYEYFNLREREIDKLDEGQSGEQQTQLGELALATKALAQEYGQ